VQNARTAVTIEDLRRLAKKRLPAFLFEPMDGGAGNGAGCRRNVERLQDRKLLPRALVDLSAAAQTTKLFGQEYSAPFGVSAIGYAGNFRRNADLILAEVAAAANIPFVLSGGSNAAIESVSRIAPKHVWYQLYGAKDPRRTDDLVGRAQAVGVSVLVFTVDFPVPPRIEKIMRSGVRPPANVRPSAIPYVLWEMLKHPAWTMEFIRQGGAAPLQSWAPYVPAGGSAAAIARDYSSQIPSNQTWKDVDRVRKLWPGKLVIKGLVHADDARRAVDAGADAITVSNHGAVKLDCMPATIDCLPRIAEAVDKRLPVLFDGGIRSGAHVVVSYCLGASFCFLGRAALYGLIAGGRDGAERAVRILQDEFTYTMAMIGCPAVQGLGRHFVDDGCLHDAKPGDLHSNHVSPE
jgi:(S)-mandelate dehydrogenase